MSHVIREKVPKPDPYCYACGDAIEAETGSGIIFTESTEWRNVKQATRCSTADLSGMYFRISWLWGTLFRVIIQRKPRPEFQVSGFGQMGNWTEGLLVVPWNRDIATIGKARRNPEKIVWMHVVDMNAEHQDQDRSQWGYPVHERCWVLIDRIIGLPRVEEHLDLLSKPYARDGTTDSIMD